MDQGWGEQQLICSYSTIVVSMDALTIVAMGKFAVSAVLAIGAVYALIKGISLFVTGIGLKKSGTKIEFEIPHFKIKMADSTIGGGIALTSIVWAILAVVVAPDLSTGRSGRSDEVLVRPHSTEVCLGRRNLQTPCIFKFKVGTDELSAGEGQRLRFLADALKMSPKEFVIALFSKDNAASDQIRNEWGRLSMFRAVQLARQLEAYGISMDRIMIAQARSNKQLGEISPRYHIRSFFSVFYELMTKG